MKMTYDADHDCALELRTVRLRATPARLGVLHALEDADTPIDVATIIGHVRSRGVAADEATIFRILRVFTDKGLVKTIQFHEDKMRFEHAGKPSHHHFVCEKCGMIDDVVGCTVHELEKIIEKKKGVTVTRHTLEFFGVCARCR